MNVKAFAMLFVASILAVDAAQGIAKADAQSAQKVIKDKAEFDAFIAAQKITNPTEKAAAMEAFIAKYPSSIVKTNALDQAIAAYQQRGDTENVENTAKRLLALEPDNLGGLSILTGLEREKAATGDPNALTAMSDYAKRGLRALPIWRKPNKISASDFSNLRSRFGSIFNSAIGFSLLNAKSYDAARDYYVKAIKNEPRDVQNLYQLGIAETQMTPFDADGFWYLARATALAIAQNNMAGAQEIEKYAKAEYHQYHGNDDGWDAIVSDTEGQITLPGGFSSSIRPGPTPPEIAIQVVRDHDPATLSIVDWEYVLSFRDSSPANKDAADKVWSAIKAKEQNGTVPFQISVMVISATDNSFDAAITDANIAAMNPDIHVDLARLLVPQPAPKPRTKVNVVGVITSYGTKPFLFTMTHGRL
jgi:tetratricopeptide (TPR) repeat protein